MDYQQILDSQTLYPQSFVGDAMNALISMEDVPAKQYDSIRGIVNKVCTVESFCITLPRDYDAIHSIRLNPYLKPVRMEMKNENGSIYQVYYPDGNLFTFDPPIYAIDDCNLYIFVSEYVPVREIVEIDCTYFRDIKIRQDLTTAFEKIVSK